MEAAPPPLRGLEPARVDRLVADLLTVAADLRVVAACQHSRFLEGGIAPSLGVGHAGEQAAP